MARRRHYTPAEIEIVRRLYPDTLTRTIGEQIGRHESSIYTLANRLGLKKSAAYLAGENSGRLTPLSRAGAAYQFKPGQPAWNKGKKYNPGGRSAETRFKPGSRNGVAAARWVPVGSYRVNSDGYLDRKTSDAGRGPRDWTAVHRLVWIEAHGPIPHGHVVVFRPGRRTTVLEDITLDALELVSRVELMRRNSALRYGVEIQQTMAAIGRLRKAIERKAS